MRVREGDRVVAGAVLVRLADGDLRAQEAAARAALDAALANERRVRTLVPHGYLPAAQLDSAEAQRAQAQAQLGAAREALTYAEIRAPFAGAVLAKLVSPGDLVAPGQPMIELAGARWRSSPTPPRRRPAPSRSACAFPSPAARLAARPR